MSRCAMLFSATARAIRRIRPARRFDRVRASRKLYRLTLEWWQEGIDDLFDYLNRGGWDRIQRHVRQRLPLAALQKALSDDDRRFLVELLAGYRFFDDIEQRAAAIVEATRAGTFNEAARFALRQLGVASPTFEVRNERILHFLMERKLADAHAARNNLDGILGAILENFYHLGRNPYDSEFIARLKKEMGSAADWQARRLALTETGIASELAQIEVYRRNGVTRKRWNILGVNTRDTHAALSGVEIGIEEQFDVGGYPADHPLDPRLPAKELVNCHCWLTPVVSDDFQLDPARIWEGD